MKIYLISPLDVRLTTNPSRRDITHQKLRLGAEGQIEPVIVHNMTPDLDEWAYADAQIVAARELGWPTILITY